MSNQESVFRGIARNVRWRDQPNAPMVLSFRIEQVDSVGNIERYIPIEMKGLVGIQGSLEDGDEIEVVGDLDSSGNISHPDIVRNLTTQSQILRQGFLPLIEEHFRLFREDNQSTEISQRISITGKLYTRFLALFPAFFILIFFAVASSFVYVLFSDIKTSREFDKKIREHQQNWEENQRLIEEQLREREEDERSAEEAARKREEEMKKWEEEMKKEEERLRQDFEEEREKIRQ